MLGLARRLWWGWRRTRPRCVSLAGLGVLPRWCALKSPVIWVLAACIRPQTPGGRQRPPGAAPRSDSWTVIRAFANALPSCRGSARPARPDICLSAEACGTMAPMNNSPHAQGRDEPRGDRHADLLPLQEDADRARHTLALQVVDAQNPQQAGDCWPPIHGM